MSNVEKASFKFTDIVFRESHFVLNEPGEFEIEVDFTPKGFVYPNKNRFTLDLNVNVKEVSGKFDIKVHALGFFSFPKDANIETYKTSFFSQNAPAIIFPYIRAYIATITAQSGIFTVNLPTFNLQKMGKQLLENISMNEQVDDE